MSAAGSKQIDIMMRVSTMLMDHFIMSIIAMPFFIPGLVASFSAPYDPSAGPQSSIMQGGAAGYISLLGLALYFCKDSINGRSIAKRILKLQVVDNSTGQAASPLRCFARNIFIVIWPIEAIIALINPARRLGDQLAGTRLVVFDPALAQPKINTGWILISVVLAYALMLLLMSPLM